MTKPHFRATKQDVTGIDSELEKVIDGCLNNNRLSQKRLYEMYAPRMYAVCRRYANSTAEAEDMLMEGFMNIFKNLHTFKSESSFFSWIYSVMVNSSISHFRSVRRFRQELSQEDMDMEVSENDEDTIIVKVSAGQVIELLEKMPETPRVVFNLKEVEGYSYEEIAEKLGRNEGAVRMAYLRAKKWLRSKLEKEETI